MARSREEIEAEVTALERLAAKSRGKPGLSERVQEIEKRIADAKAELGE
jgi:hypothetical protein